MNDHAAETRRLSEPTLAFHNQPTVAVPTNDLARELFRQCAAAGPTGGGARAQSSSWDMPTAPHPRLRGQLRSVLVCVGCLFLGVGAGHLVREGSAYAAGAVVLGAFGPTRTTVARARPETHTASTVGAIAHGAARAKDVTSAPEVPGVSRRAHVPSSRRGGHAQPSSRPAAPSAMDALFLDFEPTFRVAQ
jgi:hypothetical protein